MKGNHWKCRVNKKKSFSAIAEKQDTTSKEENEKEQSNAELDDEDDSIFAYVKKMKQKERLKLVNVFCFMAK